MPSTTAGGGVPVGPPAGTSPPSLPAPARSVRLGQQHPGRDDKQRGGHSRSLHVQHGSNP